MNFTVSAPVVFIWLETPLRGIWSDNAFVGVPGLTSAFESGVVLSASDQTPPVTVSVQWIAAPDGAVPSVEELSTTLHIWSLYDVWAGRPVIPI